MNEKELDKLSIVDGKKQSEIFALYKEKIIDYDLPYTPTVEEHFEKFYSDITKHKDIIFDFFNEHQMTNLRVGNQILEKLNTFKTFLVRDYHRLVFEEFIFSALSIFTFKVQFSLTREKYDEVKKYYASSWNKESKKDKEKEELTTYLYKFDNKTYENVFWSFLEEDRVDAERINEEMESRNSNLTFLQKKEELENKWHLLHIDFKYSLTDFCEEAMSILEDQDIVKIISLGNFHFFTQFIRKHKVFNSGFLEKTVKKYIDYFIEKEKSISVHASVDTEIIETNYPQLMSYWEEEKHKRLIRDIDEKGILGIFEKVTKGWGPKDEYVLNNIDIEDYKKLMIESKDFVQEMVGFLRNRRGDKTHFPKAIENLKQALQELSTQNKDYKFKVEKILKEIEAV